MDNMDDIVGDIFDQLQSQNTITKKERLPVSREELERNILDQAQQLVNTALDSVDTMSSALATAPNGEDAAALAALISSTSTAIETITKVIAADKKIENSINLKQMDIDSKKDNLETAIGAKLVMSREELLKHLFAETKQLEIVSEVKLLDDSN